MPETGGHESPGNDEVENDDDDGNGSNRDGSESGAQKEWDDVLGVPTFGCRKLFHKAYQESKPTVMGPTLL